MRVPRGGRRGERSDRPYSRADLGDSFRFWVGTTSAALATRPRRYNAITGTVESPSKVSGFRSGPVLRWTGLTFCLSVGRIQRFVRTAGPRIRPGGHFGTITPPWNPSYFVLGGGCGQGLHP